MYSDSPLGKTADYNQRYNPNLLFPIARHTKRDEIGIDSQHLPFHGVDIWNAYELSWLNSQGKPFIAVMVFTLPCESEKIIESKSIKLYLNSFNQARFGSADEVKNLIQHDFSAAAKANVHVELIFPSEFSQQRLQELPGYCLDDLNVTIDCYETNPHLLTTEDHIVEEQLVSHLMKSNCLVTNQPDWGSIYIHYRGRQINHENLLKYIVSYRQHNEFHEQCVERVFMHLLEHCQPEKLTVYARYTRRGGLDINPFRSNFEDCLGNLHSIRQ